MTIKALVPNKPLTDKQLERQRIAEQVAAFTAAGGVIDTKPGFTEHAKIEAIKTRTDIGSAEKKKLIAEQNRRNAGYI